MSRIKDFVRSVLLSLIPVDGNCILFESESDFSENTRAVYDYMIRCGYNRNHKLIWNVRHPEQYMKVENVVFIDRNDRRFLNRIRWFYYLGRVKYFLFTHPYWLHEWKKSQIVINLAHGNPLKGCKHRLYHVADYVLASGEDGVKYRKKEYLDTPEIVVLGPPRNDWLFEGRDCVLKYAGNCVFDKIIFCLPTFKQASGWRDSEEQNPFFINTIASEVALNRLNEILRSNRCLMICKIHHLQVMDGLVLHNLSHIRYLDDEALARNGDVLYQLLAGADALLTDFSSVYMDYLLLGRPIGFFTDQTEEYTRGFMVENPMDYMPGEKIEDFSGLVHFISGFDREDLWKEQRKRVCKRIHKYSGNENSRRFVEYFEL